MTATMTQAARGRRRAKVRRLAAQGLANRVIAKRAGVSESTVRRWRTADAPGGAAATRNGAPHAAPHAAPHDAPGDAPVTQTPAPDDATHDAPGDALTVVLDDELRDHLAVLADAGHDAQAAVAMALSAVADAYRYALDYGLTQPGTAPEIRVRVKGDALPAGVAW